MLRFPLERRRRIYVNAALLILVLNLADVAITRAALARGATELNPVTRWFIEHALIAYTVKILVPSAVLALAMLPRSRIRINEFHIAAIWMVVGIYLTAVALNTVTWFRLG